MNMERHQKDLLVVVADADMRETFLGLLPRTQAFGIGKIAFDVVPHPNHDGGCRVTGMEFLRPFSAEYRYALMIFDFEGCGNENISAVELEDSLEKMLQRTGWGRRAIVIVLEPELESWVWSPSQEVDRILGWPDSGLTLREWLKENGWTTTVGGKPDRPKEAMHAVLRAAKKGKSPARFRQLAERVSFKECTARSFRKLATTLQGWFGIDVSNHREPL